jgi:hypothetical protein
MGPGFLPLNPISPRNHLVTMLDALLAEALLPSKDDETQSHVRAFDYDAA